MVVAQEVDVLVFLTDLVGTGFIPATFGQPLAKFLEVVLAALHNRAHFHNSQFILQLEEESNRVVKMINEQQVILVGDLRVLHEMVYNTAFRPKEGPVWVLYLAGVDFWVEDVACLGLA